MTRIEKPKERDANKEMDRPIKDEIEVVHLKDGSRSRRNFRPLSIRPDNNQQLLYASAVKNSAADDGRINGYSNGYGSASDMEINEPDDDDPSDDANDGDDLAMPPSPPRKVKTLVVVALGSYGMLRFGRFMECLECVFIQFLSLFTGNDRNWKAR